MWLQNTFKTGDAVRSVPGAEWCNHVANWINNLQGIDGVIIHEADANGYGAAIGLDASAVFAWQDTGEYDAAADWLVYADIGDSGGFRLHLPGNMDTATYDTTYDIPVKTDNSDTSAGRVFFADSPVVTDTAEHIFIRAADGSQGWKTKGGLLPYTDTAAYSAGADIIVYADLTDTSSTRLHVPGNTDTGSYDTTYDLKISVDNSDTSSGKTFFTNLAVITDTATHVLGRTSAGAYGWIAVEECDS